MRLMFVQYIHDTSIKIILNARWQAAGQHPPISGLCQRVDLIEQFLLFGFVHQGTLFIGFEVVVVRLSHNADIGTRFFRDPDEICTNAKALQAFLQKLTCVSTQKSDSDA